MSDMSRPHRPFLFLLEMLRHQALCLFIMDALTCKKMMCVTHWQLLPSVVILYRLNHISDTSSVMLAKIISGSRFWVKRVFPLSSHNFRNNAIWSDPKNCRKEIMPEHPPFFFFWSVHNALNLCSLPAVNGLRPHIVHMKHFLVWVCNNKRKMLALLHVRDWT